MQCKKKCITSKYKLKTTSWKKLKKSAEAGCLKLLHLLNFYFYSVVVGEKTNVSNSYSRLDCVNAELPHILMYNNVLIGLVFVSCRTRCHCVLDWGLCVCLCVCFGSRRREAKNRGCETQRNTALHWRGCSFSPVNPWPPENKPLDEKHIAAN